MLQSSDARLAANKQLIYDFWRIVLEAGHLERADEYLTDDYIQHNPNIGSGREAFVEAFRAVLRRKDVADRVAAPLIAVVAEGNLVVFAIERRIDDQRGSYTTTWFDMFRVEDGRIAEHWDSSTLQGK